MKVLIVDDEPLARERLQDLLADFPGMEVAGTAANGRAALEAAEASSADCVLLDIAMPVMDGLEAARHLSTFPQPPAVVFCTAYDEHALAAFEAAAIDYLVKPVRRDRLHAALEKARRFTADRAAQVAASLNSPNRRTHICARVRGNLKLVPVADVQYCLAEDKYVNVHYDGGTVLIEESLRALETEFADRFVRIHRNCLVAIDRITGLRRAADGQVHADIRDADVSLEVSRRNLPHLRKLVKSI
jgi:two-component system response regulator AlgR